MSKPKAHSYEVEISWVGNLGDGTSHYCGYSRDHEIGATGKPTVPGSSDPSFRGDPSRYNPEELLVASLSACQMLWYLHVCCEAGIVVTEYRDVAKGTMQETPEGGGRFTEVVLAPVVMVREGADLALAEALHRQAHQKCFIAGSVNFPVVCRPTIAIGPPTPEPSAAAAASGRP